MLTMIKYADDTNWLV